MPRLEGFIEYRFVEPGWKHPLGYKVAYPTDIFGRPLEPEIVDQLAARQAEFARQFEMKAAVCDHAECGRTDGVWSCQRRAASARDCTRTPTRTVLVKVFIPVNNQ